MVVILELVAINDLGNIESNAHLLKFDSLHGQIPNNISADLMKFLLMNHLLNISLKEIH